MKRKQRGAALVEFALVALVAYLIMAGGIELGRQIFVSQTLQDAARLAARELAVTPVPADTTFETALANVFNANMLVVDISCGPTDAQMEDYMNNQLPLVNRALRPLLIYETINGTRKLLRYPGALLSTGQTYNPAGACPANATDLTVGIPRVTGRGANGVETIDWVPVVAEVRSNPIDINCAPYGPFSFVDAGTPPPQCGTDVPLSARGMAAVQINYPFQAAMLSGFQKSPPTAGDPLPPNFSNVIGAADGSVSGPAGPSGTAGPAGATGIYGGPFGLGEQQAFAKTVRPYRSLLVGQALFRREVVSQ